MLATPRSLSQLTTSFIASYRLGIHRVPVVAWSPTCCVAPEGVSHPRARFRFRYWLARKRLEKRPISGCPSQLELICIATFSIAIRRLQGRVFNLRTSRSPLTLDCSLESCELETMYSRHAFASSFPIRISENQVRDTSRLAAKGANLIGARRLRQESYWLPTVGGA